MTKKILTSFFIGLLVPAFVATAAGTAQTSAGTPQKLEAKIGGRFLLDGLAHLGNVPNSLNHQVDITDIRLTGQLFYEDWYLRIDIGFDRNQVGIKDSFLQYKKNAHQVRIGHTLGAFGLDPSVGTYDYIFNSPANIHNLIFFGRRIGLMYTYDRPKVWISAGAFMGDNLKITKTTEQGFNSTLRMLWRPFNEEGRVLHAGISGLFRRPNRDKATDLRTIDLGATGVTFLNSPLYQHLSLPDARNQSVAGAEIYLGWDKWMLQAEYLGMFINRFNAPTYIAHGGYLQLGYLLTGKSFGYDSGEALPTSPAQPKSLQLVARYNFSTLNDCNAGLFGGRQHDISIGLNYQFNKYIGSRLNYSCILLDEHSPLAAEFTNTDHPVLHQIQARIAFWF